MAHARGMCNMHYNRYRRSPGYVRAKPPGPDPLPSNVFAGDVIVDVDGHGVVVNGIDGKVHLFLDANVGRSFRPGEARYLAQSLLDAALVMEASDYPHSDVVTERLERAAAAPREAVEAAAWARRHVAEAWKRGR